MSGEIYNPFSAKNRLRMFGNSLKKVNTLNGSLNDKRVDLYKEKIEEAKQELENKAVLAEREKERQKFYKKSAISNSRKSPFHTTPRKLFSY